MEKVNKIVFVVLFLSGIAMAVAIFFDLDKGSYFLRLAGIATFVGWFFSVFAALACLVSSLRFFMSHIHNFWDSLYPVNFGFALLGISIMGMDVKQELTLLLLCTAIAFVMSLLIYRLGLLSRKELPLGIIALLFLPAVPALSFIWAYYYFVLGLLLISLFVFTKSAGRDTDDQSGGVSSPVSHH